MGLNTFLPPYAGQIPAAQQLIRADERERRQQLEDLSAFQTRHAREAPAARARLQAVARAGGNVFEELLETVKVASLGQVCAALFEVGGRYRRSM